MSARLCTFCTLPIQPGTLPEHNYPQVILRDAAAHLAGYCSAGCQLAHAGVVIYKGHAWWQKRIRCRCEGRHWVHDQAADLGIRTCECMTRNGVEFAREALWVQHAATCGCSRAMCPTCGDDGVVHSDDTDGHGEHVTTMKTCPTCQVGVIR